MLNLSDTNAVPSPMRSANLASSTRLAGLTGCFESA
ncbi:Uncharacterised protein [Mycobacteroides abscessus subsp. abscessus]|nr:Uncharacterised protein [Mycobacteroides abscessus subsp. abscessus]